MKITSILIANRGEIAIRVARAAAELGIKTTAVYSVDDKDSLHVRAADRSYALQGRGTAAYLDMGKIIDAARESGCDAIHPGYGFLSENASFACLCAQRGIIFIGPPAEILELFGNKLKARALAERCGVPVLPATPGPVTLEEARVFFAGLGPEAAVMIKSVAGGGGRGMREVYDLKDLEAAYSRCQSEARSAFGDDLVYLEQLVYKPRHIEVQIAGDGSRVTGLGERDCTIQRRNQKLMEVAPAPNLPESLRDRIMEAALRIAGEVRYANLGTVEFLVQSTDRDAFTFMEVNPRLQVEHTVTEEVTGVDLVQTQIELAAGKTLLELGLAEKMIRPRGFAIQMRINMEKIDAKGAALPAAGSALTVYEAPGGPGIRVDGYGYAGYPTSLAFDSLLAKLIVYTRSPRYGDALAKACRALKEFRIGGVTTNIPLLLNLLRMPEVAACDLHTRFVEENAGELAAAFQEQPVNPVPVISESAPVESSPSGPEGTVPLRSSLSGRVVSITVDEGDPVFAGQVIAVIEAMKMEHEIMADRSGYVRQICVDIDDFIKENQTVIFLEEAPVEQSAFSARKEMDLDEIRSDLAEVMERHAFGLDENRPDAVARRREKNRRTSRENIDDLIDPGSFIEYGALVTAAQRLRRPMEELIRKTPADGLIMGTCTVNREDFGEEHSRCVVLAYDYTVLAGTQGSMNHKKMDRMLSVTNKWKLPLVLFAEGGGGRPGDDGLYKVGSLDLPTFTLFAALSGKVPVVGIVSGYCFAGNASLLGCCDVIIAAKDSNIGMGGPAMIQYGGLGETRPEDIGPIDIQKQNGVVDVLVENEAEGVAMARRYLSYFQGDLKLWEMADQRLLRHVVPENRLRVYDIRDAIRLIADTGSVLELRPWFGPDMITALLRIEGKPFGLIANNPKHISGAIEPEGADKAARFMQLCNAHNLPILSLLDTPGFMVGPEVEKRAHVRKTSRMFVVGANLRVPLIAVVLRKAYGLGALSMVAGSFHNSVHITSWPTGEYGGMGLEGAALHAYRREMDAIEDPKEREEFFKQRVAELYRRGKAINTASVLEIDSVIDPADTRKWIMRSLKSVPPEPVQDSGRMFVDTW